MKTDPQNNIRKILNQHFNLVIFTAIFWLLTLFGPLELFGISKDVLRPYTSGAILVLSVMHGLRRYGWKNMLVWFGITFVLTWSIEAFSITSSVPFGQYHYTDRMGAKLGPVPWGIMFAYFSTGYFAWSLGTIFLGNLSKSIEKRNLILVPLVGSAIMLMWDFCFDPILSTVRSTWIWEEGGAYFGVPITNYLGWFLTVYLVFQLYALYLYKFEKTSSQGHSKTYWLLVPIIYLGIAAEYLLNPFHQSDHLEIYRSMALAAALTMVFVSLLAMIHSARLSDKQLE